MDWSMKTVKLNDPRTYSGTPDVHCVRLSSGPRIETIYVNF